jgi:creatinine amidohydrolase/Fe(II)-dependent formamide hydrolase-like protein
MHRYLTCLLIVAVAAFLALGQKALNPDPNTPRPIDALDTVFIEDMTWMEVRDALKAGKTTAIVATGGVEQNGPYLATGKHNIILRILAELIARLLGNTLVAPVVPFVPEGDIDPPTGHMKYPGTISVRESTYQDLLIDICESLRVQGFKRVVLIGDSGGNQKGMAAVAEKLTSSKKWTDGKAKAIFVPEFYDYPAVARWLADQGVKQGNDGLHDDFVMTAQMMVADPSTVRFKQRVAAGKATINGVPLEPAAKTIEWGRKILDYRAQQTVKAIRTRSGEK